MAAQKEASLASLNVAQKVLAVDARYNSLRLMAYPRQSALVADYVCVACLWVVRTLCRGKRPWLAPRDQCTPLPHQCSANARVGTQYIRRRNQLLRDNASRHEETAVREAYLHLRVQVLRSKFGPLHRHREGSLASSSHTSRRASTESLHLSPETSSPRLPRQLSSSLSHGLVPTKSAEASRCANGRGGVGGA